MRLAIEQSVLLKLLQSVNGLVERKQTVPVLSSVLFSAEFDYLELLTTDNDMALSCRTLQVQVEISGKVAVPARKLLDIVKVLPAAAIIQLNATDSKISIVCASSRFSLSTFPAVEFPIFKPSEVLTSLVLPFSQLLAHFGATFFAIGEKDVRSYLNGLLISIENDHLTTVASDGHRLAMMTSDMGSIAADLERNAIQIVVFKKMVHELLKLNWVINPVNFHIGQSDIQIFNEDFRFSSRLMDAQYPDYRRVLPEGDFIQLVVNKLLLIEVLQRASVLSHDTHRVVLFTLSAGLLKLQATNAEKETAFDELAVDYTGADLELVYNVDYLLQAMHALQGEWAHIAIYQPSLIAILKDSESAKASYLLMPMRL